MVTIDLMYEQYGVQVKDAVSAIHKNDIATFAVVIIEMLDKAKRPNASIEAERTRNVIAWLTNVVSKDLDCKVERRQYAFFLNSCRDFYPFLKCLEVTLIRNAAASFAAPELDTYLVNETNTL